MMTWVQYQEREHPTARLPTGAIRILNVAYDATFQQGPPGFKKGEAIISASPEPSWIEEGEKFAIVGLNVQVDARLGQVDLPGGLTVLRNVAFELPDHWRDWLGALRSEEVEECTLFLVAKMPAKNLNVVDADDQLLQDRVAHWYGGLMLVTKFFQLNDPFLASGNRDREDVDVRHFQVLQPPHKSIVDYYSPITRSELVRAALIGERLGSFQGPWRSDHWRLLRCLGIYQAARCDRDILNRIHQFVRCIEGLIAPKKMGEIDAAGRRNRQGTKAQFKRRTELFVGVSHHELMSDMYEVRGEIEHLHEYRFLEHYDRDERLRLAKLEAISEWIARDCLSRILLDPALTAHFGSVVALDRFWAMDEPSRRAVWGAPIDPTIPISSFRFDHVNDSELGVR